jgi:hypothetical protein
MTPTINLVHDHIGPSIERYAEVMGRTLADTVKRTAKGVTRRVMAVTPPASQGMEGAAAYRAGRTKIARQMSAILAPVKLKGRRKIPVVFGRRLKRAITVPTKERHPNVSAIYREQSHLLTKRLGFRLKNYRGKKYYVDATKFQRVLKARQESVGKLASGWAEGATALDVPVQNWIARHGRGRGAVKLDLMSSKMRVTVTNRPSGGLSELVAGELRRRIGYAVTYQQAAMKREVDYYALKKAREMGIKTRNFDALVPAGMSGRSDT